MDAHKNNRIERETVTNSTKHRDGEICGACIRRNCRAMASGDSKDWALAMQAELIRNEFNSREPSVARRRNNVTRQSVVEPGCVRMEGR